MEGKYQRLSVRKGAKRKPAWLSEKNQASGRPLLPNPSQPPRALLRVFRQSQGTQSGIPANARPIITSHDELLL
jgi:hypothetical protein